MTKPALPDIEFQLRWVVEITSEQFEEVFDLSQKYRNLQTAFLDAERAYNRRLREIVKPRRDEKLAALGHADERPMRWSAKLYNEGLGRHNAKPHVTIEVNNCHGVVGIPDGEPE